MHPRCSGSIEVEIPLDQYWSALTISPLALVPRAYQVDGLIVFLMKCTEPSQNETFTPPGWKLRAAMWFWMKFQTLSPA
jgi:hypothetical protein